MEKDLNMENIEKPAEELEPAAAESTEDVVSDQLTEATETEISETEEKREQPSVDFEDKPEPQPRKYYVPRFTEVSERYRLKGDARIRERLGIKSPVFDETESNPDEIKLDPTAEFEEDVNGVIAKTPESGAKDESDESLNVLKFTDEERDAIDLEAEREREEIKKLLRPEPKEEPKEEPVEEISEEEIEGTDEKTEAEELTIPDPEESDDFGVYDFSGSADEDEDAPEGIDETAVGAKGKKAKNVEFNNPKERDSFKDKFLDSLISIKIRTGATLVFALALLVLEILSASKVITFKLLESSTSYGLLAVVDFLLAACIFIMSLPETIKAVRRLIGKTVMPELLPLPAFAVLGLYTLTVVLTGATSYPLFGLLFATVALPALSASLYRTKANFIAFKKISQDEDKQVIDKKNTRELGQENAALDGVVDEYKSKIVRTFRASFISDFFKNSDLAAVPLTHIGLIFGIPFGIGIVASLVAYFLTWSPVTALAVLALTVMLGCPAFAIIANKVSYFHTQRAALLCDSVAIGEDAYHNFSSVDVFAFDDDDLFGPDDVNLKRFMLYGERDSMERVMRQMCALFAAVGGPLDYMFSNIIDNRVRHKTATNMIIEDDGICGDVAGHRIFAGSEDYMRRNGIAIPAAATAPESGVSLDTIKIMYAAEDGEVSAKFHIRYSFSEEFTMALPSLREAGIIPLVYTRDPNISGELVETLTAGTSCIRVVKLYRPLKEEKVYPRVSASMVTYGDKLDAASMIVLSKKYRNFSLHVRFAEICAMSVGVALALVLSVIGFGRVTTIAAVLWQTVWCVAMRVASRVAFLKDARKKDNEE